MAAATIAFLAIDYARLHLSPFRSIFIVLFGSLLRRREHKSLTGGSYLMLASLVCMVAFGGGSFGTSVEQGSGVFIAAISFLAVGDTLAAIVGLSFGRLRIFRKTLEGTLAGLVACLGIAWLVSVLPGVDLPLTIGILGAVSASVVEALPIEVNDNVVVPVFAGTVMMIALQLAR
ncbi:MAG: phosphatidate cytidylyltransferase [bacterium]